MYCGIAAPVGVGALDGDLSLDDLRREQAAKLFSEIGADPHRDVVEVDEERGIGRVNRRRNVRRGTVMACGPR